MASHCSAALLSASASPAKDFSRAQLNSVGPCTQSIRISGYRASISTLRSLGYQYVKVTCGVKQGQAVGGMEGGRSPTGVPPTAWPNTEPRDGLAVESHCCDTNQKPLELPVMVQKQLHRATTADCGCGAAWSLPACRRGSLRRCALYGAALVSACPGPTAESCRLE
jgi:hypothetical protein